MRGNQASQDQSPPLTSTQSNRARQSRHQTSNSYSETLDLEVYEYRQHFTLPDSIADSPIPLRFESDRVQETSDSIELESYPSISEIRRQNLQSELNQFHHYSDSNQSSRSLAHPFEMYPENTPTQASFSRSNGASASNGNNATAGRNGRNSEHDNSLYDQLRWSRSKAPMSWSRRKKVSSDKDGERTIISMAINLRSRASVD